MSGVGYKEYYEEEVPGDVKACVEFHSGLMRGVIAAREALGMTQKQLARACGMKQSAISRLENMDVMPKVDTLIDLLYPLGLTLSVVPLEEAARDPEKMRADLDRFRRRELRFGLRNRRVLEGRKKRARPRRAGGPRS